MVQRIEEAVAGGVNMVQLREKDLPGAHLLDLAQHLRQVTQGSALFIVNERLDVAIACGADGVQLGEESIPVKAARAVAGENMLVGRSVHSMNGSTVAEDQGADFLVVGTIFASRSHGGAEPSGPELLTKIASQVSLPLLGIGGINVSNVAQVIESGASGAALISGILSSENPRQAARDMLAQMMDAQQRTKPRVAKAS